MTQEPDPYFHTEEPLWEAIDLDDEQEAFDWTKKLLESGEDPNSFDGVTSITPLGLAWTNGYTRIIQLFLDAGAKVEFPKDFDISSCIVDAPIEASLLLLDRGIGLTPLTYTNPQGDLMCEGFNNILTRLIAENEYDKIDILKPYGLMEFLNAFESDLGWAPLIEMVEEGNIDGVHWLLQHGADVNAHCESQIGDTALDKAVHNSNIDIIRILLDAGANPNIPTWMWNTVVDRVVNYSTGPRKPRHDLDNKPDLVEIRKLVLDASKKFPKPIYPNGSTPDIWPPLPRNK